MGKNKLELRRGIELLVTYEAVCLGMAISFMAPLVLPSIYTTAFFILIVVFQPAWLGLLLIGVDSRVRPELAKWKGEFYCLVLWLGIAQAGAAGGRGMAGAREEFRSKFNPLAAMEAQRCPPMAVMGQSDFS